MFPIVSATEYIGELSSGITQEELEDNSYQNNYVYRSSSGGGSGYSPSNNVQNNNPVAPFPAFKLPDFNVNDGDEIIITSKPKTSDKGQLKKSIKFALKKKEKASFQINEETHSLELIEIYEKKIKFTLSSDPITDTIRISEIKKYDLDGDSIEDISVFLKSIEGDQADLEIEKIEIIEEKSSPTGAVAGTTQETSWKYLILLGTIIIAFLAGMFFQRKTR